MVGRTIEYVAKGATLLNLPAALVNADYLLDMHKSYKLNVLAALKMEDKAKEIGHSFMLYPVNVDSDSFEYRIMVRNYTGEDYYLLPEVNENGEPVGIPVQFNPSDYKETTEKVEQDFTGSKSYVDPISSMIMQIK